MMLFTCKHCDETLKIKSVPKHYYTKCLNVKIAVTCVGCRKDFHGQKYRIHTKCTSAEQKHPGKGSKAKAKPKIRDKRQKKWMAMIQNIVETETGLSQNEVDLLQFLIKHENVPRRNHKFQIYIDNAARNKFTKETVEEVWLRLEAARASLRESEAEVEANKEKPSKRKKKKPKSGSEEIEDVEGKPKKKKQKKSEDDSVMDDSSEVEAGPPTAVKVYPIKKKKVHPIKRKKGHLIKKPKVFTKKK